MHNNLSVLCSHSCKTGKSAEAMTQSQKEGKTVCQYHPAASRSQALVTSLQSSVLQICNVILVFSQPAMNFHPWKLKSWGKIVVDLNPLIFPWVQQHTNSHHIIVQNCISYWGNKSKFHFLLKSCSWYNYMLLLLCWWQLFFVIDTMSMSTMTLWVQLLGSFLLLNFWWATTITFWLSLMTDQSYHDSVTVCIELKTKFTKSKRCECDHACNNLTSRKHR